MKDIEQSSIAIRPLDILVLCKLLSSGGNFRNLKQLDLAYLLQISQPSISLSVSRLISSRLVTHSGDLIPDAAAEFILSGVKYLLPAEPGPITVGMPTAHAAPAISSNFRYAPEDIYVWPDPAGEVRGQVIKPIHKSAAPASKHDPKLYEILALIDLLRIGRSREVRYAKERLTQIIGTNK